MESAIQEAARRLGYETVREKQLEVITEFVSGKDVFAVLPTVYGKSLCYASLPWTLILTLCWGVNRTNAP